MRMAIASWEKREKMSDRLISADKLLRDVKEYHLSDGMFQHWVEIQQTVDAIEVVRCKDCKHYWKNNPSNDIPVCLASPKDDAFCSEGERKEDV